MNPEEKEILAFNDAQSAFWEASNFSKQLAYNIPETTLYLKVVSDNHNQLDPLINSLEEASLLPNMKVIFLGDQMNTALKDSKTSPYESKPVQIEVDTIKYAIEKSGINKDQILLYLDGNHEDREKKNTSIQLGKIVTDSLGISDRYAGNQALLTLNLTSPLNKEEKIPVTVFASHGQGRGGGPGAEADKSLNPFIKGVDIVLAGDTHKVVCANRTTEIFALGTNKKLSKNTFFANLGTDLPQENYLLEKGIPPRAVRDGEIIKVSLIPNKEKNSIDLAVDFVNIRQVLPEQISKIKNEINKRISEYEEMTFSSKQDLDKAYKKLLSEVLAITKVSAPSPTSKHPKELKIAVISGIREEFDKNPHKEKKCDEKLDQIVTTIQKLKNAVVILNGDLIPYKKADLKKETNFPQATYDYLKCLAEKLEPIKDKIIAYNSGKNEDKIMRQASLKHALELAKIALESDQIDFNLVYEPLTLQAKNSAKSQIQNDKIREYNNNILNKEYNKNYKNNSKNIALLLEEYKTNLKNSDPFYGEDLSADTSDASDIKHILVLKLRKENKLLSESTPSGKREISRLFPISKINPTLDDYEKLGLLKPNRNIIQNILCKLLELNPKSISINADLDETCDNFVKLTNANGETQGINIVSSYKSNTKTRKSAERNLIGKHNGADVYITNGKEYCTKEQTFTLGSNGLNKQIVWHIGTGRLIDPETTFRIYEIRSEKAKNQTIKSGIYEDTNSTTLTCSSKSLVSALKENSEDNTKQIIKKLMIGSYQKKFKEVQEATIEKTINSFSSIFDRKVNSKLKQITEEKQENGKNDGGQDL